jgi:hypothetical protein
MFALIFLAIVVVVAIVLYLGSDKYKVRKALETGRGRRRRFARRGGCLRITAKARRHERRSWAAARNSAPSVSGQRDGHW